MSSSGMRVVRGPGVLAGGEEDEGDRRYVDRLGALALGEVVHCICRLICPSIHACMYVCMYMRTVVHGQERTVEEDFGVGQHLNQTRFDDAHLETM